VVAGGVLTLTSAGTVAVPAITVNASATADINGILTSTPAIVVNGNLNFGAADANNDPASGILVWNLGSLTVGSGGDVVVGLAGSSATRGLVTTSTLANIAGGTLDLTNNDMIVFGGNPTAVSGEVTSSSAAANPTLLTLAVVQNTGQFSNFDTQPVNVGDVLVKFTLFGDALLTGSITAADYFQIDNGYNSQSGPDRLTGWYNGDFNGDGQINGDDYTLIDNAYNSQGSVSIAALPANQIAINTAQIAATSHASVFAVQPIAATVANPIAGDNADAQELKKRRSSAWDILESSPS
jgi:hypothetical protein